MARKKTTGSRKKTGPRFNFQLSWPGLGGVVVVSLCLLLWMFMLGVWAGQTILFPQIGPDRGVSAKQARQERNLSSAAGGSIQGPVLPDGKKRAVPHN
ncbi:hypothetical protein [Desulfogranum mediterraneum]|uniref:hypothetical protein n=1 Tax=Desulfogranum mediterraneum TaxID=160661 RepID=UPI00040D9A71|nr:hypothetical protein [Desulfogranum mediterraneum]